VPEASRYSVLVVEDNPDLVMGLQDFLQHDDFEVTVAGTVARAIELVRAHRFNVIILDLGLPDGDGIEVLRETQRSDSSLPVVIVTAHISADRTVGSLAEGAFAYLTKPYDREELRHILRRAIGVKELATKAERTESLLTESEERFRSLVESASDAIVVADHHGIILSWNRSASRLFGYTNEEAVGKPLTLLMPERYRPAHEKGLALIESTGTGRVMGTVLEVHGLRHDGTEFPIELSLATWNSTAGNFYSGIIRDISVRKKTEDALHRSEKLLRDVADNTTAVIYVKDAAGRYLFVNRRFEQIFNLTADQIMGHTDYEIFPREAADAFRANDVMVIEQNRTIESEEVAPHTDGPHTYISIKFPLCDYTGKPYATCGISTDITDRKRMETALRTSQEHLRQTLQASNTGLWDWNTETNDVWLSREWKHQLGYEEADLRDAFETWETRLHPDDHDQAMAYVRAFLTHPVGDYQQEFRLRHKDGTYRWIEARASFIIEPDGRRVRLLGSHTDITERKSIEHNLRSLTEQLHLALAVTEVGMWNWDLQTHHIYWSSQVDKFLGLSDRAQPRTTSDWLELACQEDRESLARTMRQAIDHAGANLTFEHRVLKQNGSFQWYIWTGEILRDREGKALRILGTVRAAGHSA
jgi:PAS domain S-box-containing protein